MKLHIVSFAIPYPADYGGVIDVFYKIKALSEFGIEITLHCFEYGERKPQPELETYCRTVYYYKRRRDLFQQFSFTPFIVSTRKNKSLLQNILMDDAPILFEGLHSCAFINSVVLKSRKKFVRMHNVEWQYYFNLAMSENNIFKKIFFKIESVRLKFFEKKIIPATEKIFFISPEDEKYFLEKFIYPKIKSEIIFPFHPYVLNFTENMENEKKYFFFHGNLSVPENENSVREIILNIFSDTRTTNIPFLVAGKSPSASFKNFLSKFLNVELIENPSDDALQKLSQHAMAHILHVENSAGIKLKLIRSLAENQNVFAHRNLLPSESWTQYFIVFNSWRELKTEITHFNFDVINPEIFALRKKLFEGILDNEMNAKKIMESIFFESYENSQ